MRQRSVSLVLVLAAMAATLLVVGVWPASADDKDDRHGRVSHDEVMAALQRNEIRPLSEILAAAATAVPGPVVKLEVKRKQGRLLYEVKIIGDKGRLREVYVDAASLDIVKIE